MRFLEQGTFQPFVEVFVDGRTRLPIDMQDVFIQFVYYDNSASPNEVEVIADTPMVSLGDGKYVYFLDVDELLFQRDQIYYARVRATHPTDLVEEYSEQEFKVVFPGTVGKLERDKFTEGDTRVFVVDYRDVGTRLPLDMGTVTIEIAYYLDSSPTPVEVFALAPTPMVSLGNGRYVFLAEIDAAFPPNTEFFVRYRGIHPVDGTEELVQEEFSSFEISATPAGSGLQFYPVEPF